MSTAEPVLVTGGMGCIGAWVLHHLAVEGRRAVCFDLSENRSRLDLLLDRQTQEAAITFVRGNLTDPAQVQDVFARYGIARVIHLAALQVPFCRANPLLGSQVNVSGTVNIFEAARAAGIKHIAYASSVAVYGPPDPAQVGEVLPGSTVPQPATLYGVYKVANEGTARVYWQEHGISSTALRPYTVYGVGRDQGMTSDPTKAMLAAAAEKPFHIHFNGPCQYHYAPDVARLFIAAADRPLNGDCAFNLGGQPLTSTEMIQIIHSYLPGTLITNAPDRLPFPAGLADSEIKAAFPDQVPTPVEEGVRETIERFKSLLNAGQFLSP